MAKPPRRERSPLSRIPTRKLASGLRKELREQLKQRGAKESGKRLKNSGLTSSQE